MPDEQGLLLRFLAAYDKACEWIRYDFGACARIVAAIPGMVDEGFVGEAYRISLKYCAAWPPEYIALTMKFVAPLHELGYIPRPVWEEEVFDGTLIEQVHPGSYHYGAGLGGLSNSLL